MVKKSRKKAVSNLRDKQLYRIFVLEFFKKQDKK